MTTTEQQARNDAARSEWVMKRSRELYDIAERKHQGSTVDTARDLAHRLAVREWEEKQNESAQ